MQDRIIELRDIRKSYGQVYALGGVDLHVDKAEVVGLVGDNGAGKSTLIKILSGVYQPTEGKIFVAGEDVQFRSPRDAGDRGVATVFQDLGLIPLMSIARNFFLGREPEKGVFPFRRFDKEKANDIARQAMADVGIQVRDPTQAVGTLSGGERQSVAIARAIHFNARILIMDEPTAALGPQETAQVGELIKQLKSQGIGIFLISHDIHDVFDLADRLTVMKNGRVVGTARTTDVDHDEVLGMIIAGKCPPGAIPGPGALQSAAAA